MDISQIQHISEVVNILKVLSTGLIAFLIAFLITPFFTHFLIDHKIGIKIKTNSVDGQKLSFVSKLHAHKSGTPTMGGMLIWITVLLLALASHYLFPILAQMFGINFLARLDFFSRPQVWLPLFALVTAGILGLFDDWMSVKGWGSNKGGGMRFLHRDTHIHCKAECCL